MERMTTVSVVITSLPTRQCAVSDPGRREQTIAFYHVGDLIFFSWVADAHLGGTTALFFAVENETALHLAANAAQCGRRQNTFGSTRGSHVNVDSGIGRIGGMNDPGDITVGDEAH